MPAYNAEKTIEKSIKSILRQTYTNFVLAIVDDASTDSTREIASQFLDDPRVFLFSNKENMGAYYSRNYGLYAFKDEIWGYFTTHDADDISYSARYTELIRSMRNNVNGIQDMFVRKELATYKILSSKVTMAHAVFKRSVFNELGYFDETRFGGDWEHWHRLQKNNQIVKGALSTVEKELGESYVHENNLTVQIPEKSEPRNLYVNAKKAEIAEMLKEKNLYREFWGNPKATVAISKPKKAIAKPKKVAPRIAVIVLSWKRPQGIFDVLDQLSKQTYNDFSVYLSIGDLRRKNTILRHANYFREVKGLDIKVREDGNDLYSFRRLILAKELAESGVEIIFFLDDDIHIPENYIDVALSQYEDNTYHSGYAWSLLNNGKDYYNDRDRRKDNDYKIHYCGAGVAMLDAKILKDPGITDPNTVPPGAYKIEDLWLSYYVDHVLKLKLKYMDIPNLGIGGADTFALHRAILSEDYTKTSFLHDLVKMGWKIPKKLTKA